ncbi:MAG: membrane dipeptidase [Deltaproteobacteria bacterium]|nr:membrane dipeptidase [Deltaproteobacteria bacterium]
MSGKPSTLALTFLLVLGAATVSAQATYGPEHLERAKALHAKAIVLDTHSDVTPKFEDPSWNFAERHGRGHMDIPRLRDAGFNAQFLSIYMGKTPGEGRAIKKAVTRIDAVWATIAKHPDVLEFAGTAADVRRITKAGKISCLMGIEGGHIIENSLPALRMLYRLGCRYMTLTHGFNTVWADSSGTMSDVEGEFNGLNERGIEIVKEMNRLGMMVDISHVADATFWDAIKHTTAPVIASHSSVDGVFAHRRNLSDPMLRAVRDQGGVVMINFFSGYIDPDWAGYQKAWEAEHKGPLAELATKFKANRREYRRARREFMKKHPMKQTPLTVLARHVEHCAKVAGWDHVGIGADWDGVSALPEGIVHCGDTVKLTALLIARGAKEKDLEKFLGDNLLRVMAACEKVAQDQR